MASAAVSNQLPIVQEVDSQALSNSSTRAVSVPATVQISKQLATRIDDTIRNGLLEAASLAEQRARALREKAYGQNLFTREPVDIRSDTDLQNVCARIRADLYPTYAEGRVGLSDRRTVPIPPAAKDFGKG